MGHHELLLCLLYGAIFACAVFVWWLVVRVVLRADRRVVGPTVKAAPMAQRRIKTVAWKTPANPGD